ncbi:MAG: sugar kinase [Cellulomonas sp.]|uniref:sugar kinase n=1 Tax=Cellulomonas sp. 73-92 TaxID=1895740 RepID=UPI000A826395|nr:sugar kinase [Cellulomonas sp. 73-92]MBN9374592.1 sugar kinase [Cellulomonas sp.]
MSGAGVFVGFGDLLMRLEPPASQRVVQSSEFRVGFTGAEANAAVLLANLGVPTRVASKVPASPVGQACVNFLRRYGVDTSTIVRGGERLGIFFVETGAAQRASTVIYDRAHSSFATSAAEDYDWATILDGARWLHFSGTAPALGESVRGALREGLQTARERGITVSCDLNYRARMWSPAQAHDEMTRLAPLIDVLFGNEEDAATVFGIRAEGSDVTKGELPVESYQKVAERLMDTFGFGVVATSLRSSVSASHNRWAGMMSSRDGHFVSRTYDITPIVDRVGGGDSFAGGLIFGLMRDDAPQDCVEFAAAASCLKHSIPGDLDLVSEDEVRALVGGDGSGRVRR